LAPSPDQEAQSASWDVTTSDVERWQQELQEHDPAAAVIVDLDHTLLLSNSTTEYLRSIRPRFLAVSVLAALWFLKPWRWARWVPAQERDLLSDPFRVIVCTLLFPWTPLLWRRRGRILGAQDANHLLIDALARAGRGQVVVATLAARFIVEPILAGLEVEASHVVAGTFWRGDKIRRAGKAAAVKAALGADLPATAYFITDSADDDLLAHVAVPILHQWPETVYRSVWDGVYVPYAYTERVKRSVANHFWRPFLLDESPRWASYWKLPVASTLSNHGDLTILILAIGLTQPSDFALYFALVLGLLSFYAIYEIGYHENDVMGARYEANPKLSELFDPAKHYSFVPGAYVWASGTGALAVWLAADNDAARFAVTGVLWVGLLASLRVVFALYNRGYRVRLLLYPVLQAHKTFGFLILGPASLAGLLLMTAQVGRRWMQYGCYRIGRDQGRWRDLRFWRLVLYLALAATVEATNRGVNLFEDWRFWVITAWLLVVWGLRRKHDLAAHSTDSLQHTPPALPGRAGHQTPADGSSLQFNVWA
jgi:hypothetical protein